MTIGELKRPKPNYTAKQIAERLLKATEIARNKYIHLTPKQTLVISVIQHSLSKMELEYDK